MIRDDEIAGLLLRWEEAWEHGEDIPARLLCAESPDLEPAVRDQIEALKATAWVKEPPTGDEDDGAADERCGSLPRTLGGRYRIDGLIAEGGYGSVFRAYDPELQRHVAIKVPRLREAADDSLLEEARRAGGLRHPGIVSVHDVGRDGGMCFFVSDLIEGENLADRIARDRPEPAEAARIIAEVAEALHFAHVQGFIHRDIKPANILIDRHGRPLVTDFGIAATKDELARIRVATSGTLPYMAPEQVAGEVQLIDARTDVYALGVVLHELLAGRHPYQARTPTALREQILFRLPMPLRPEDRIPPDLERAMMRCLAKHPADRHASAQELSDELRATLTRSRAWRPVRWLSIILGVTLLGGLLLGLNYMRHTSSSGSSAPKYDAPIAQDGVLFFDGRTRVVTPLERFAPVTLEAWVRPESYQDHGNQFLIGSDIPTKYGLGLSISGAILSAEYVPGMMFSGRAVPLREWSHVAAVFGEAETRLYLNGERVHVGPKTEPVGGTKFVIGCAGEANPIDHFRGRVRSVRVSPGERFSGDFRPPETFPPGDPEAVLIYDGSKVEGDRVIDLSGRGNHGVVQGMSRR